MILNMDPLVANSAPIKSIIGDALKQFKSATKTPEIYLKIQEKRAARHKELVKSLFDYAKVTGGQVMTTSAPSELIIDDMDDEQIWQQLELHNELLWSQCLRDTSKLLSAKDAALTVRFRVAGNEESSENEDAVDEQNESDAIEEQEEEEEEEAVDEEESDAESETDTTTKRHGRTSIVDDAFFKLDEMNAFLESEDRKEMRKTSGKRTEESDNDFDYFKADDNDDLDDENNYKYSDFFGNVDNALEDDDEKRQRRRARLEVKNKTSAMRKKADLGLEDVSGAEEEDDEEADSSADDKNAAPSGSVKFDLSKNSYRSDSDGNGDEDEERRDPFVPMEELVEKSTFEHRQERLRLRISDMEDQVMGEKSWQLRGEIDSTSRPQNSLLEEVLEFDTTTRPAPIITEETTMRLEDIIRQRIKDKAWNDVERKYKTENTPAEFRKKLTLDQEKSKESLAQIYEKEYLREVDRLDPNAVDADEPEPKEHTEIRTLMSDVFVKLDALSNFFYTPKPVMVEAKIITNMPAISMEEVAPVGVSDAQLLAPEDVLAKSKSGNNVLGKSERTRTDKNRERRQKKLLQRSKRLANDKRDAANEALGIVRSTKAEKAKLLEKVSKSRNVHKMKETSDGKSLKSSKQFFGQLQDEVTAAKRKGGKAKAKHGGKTNDGEISAKRFKL